jgi:cytoskeletal protein CcmA (bactofilin family)
VRGKRLGAALLGTAVALFAFAGLASAQSFRTGDNVVVGRNEVVEGSLYMAGNSLTINGRINGDVFCAGQNITVDATVTGDVICAGQTIHVAGVVEGDVRLAGQSVNIDADVRRNATIASQSITLNPDASVGQDLTGGTQNLVLAGGVDRDVTLGSELATVSGRVGRNINAQINNLRIESTATVGGDVNYTSKQDASIASGAQITGKTTRTEPQEDQKDYGKAAGAFWFSAALYLLFSLLLIALAAVLLVPGLVKRVSDQAVEHPGRTILVGILSLILAPAIIGLCLITIIGIPLAVVLTVAWTLVLMLAGPAFAFYIGRLLLRDNRNMILIMLVGALVVLVLYLLPVLGLFVALAAGVFGTGMIVSELMYRYNRPSYEVATVSDRRPAKEVPTAHAKPRGRSTKR